MDKKIKGQVYYEAAVKMLDKYQRRFCDMMSDDYSQSEAERSYFIGEYRSLELMGWATFSRRMEESGEGVWLEKINRLDEQLIVRTLERKLLDYSCSGNKEGTDLCVKALSGVLSRRKIGSEDEKGGSSDRVLQVVISGAKGVSDGED